MTGVCGSRTRSVQRICRARQVLCTQEGRGFASIGLCASGRRWVGVGRAVQRFHMFKMQRALLVLRLNKGGAKQACSNVVCIGTDGMRVGRAVQLQGATGPLLLVRLQRLKLFVRPCDELWILVLCADKVGAELGCRFCCLTGHPAVCYANVKRQILGVQPLLK
jgi:hypothetical protein